MFATRAANEAIDRYAGPYERWVFAPELGRPYAFPAIAQVASQYHTGLLEGSMTLPQRDGMSTRLPPLWNADAPRRVTPFAFHRAATGTTDHDTNVANMLSQIPRAGGITPRFRVNFPIAPAAWVPTYVDDGGMDQWLAPHTPPKAIVAVIDDAIPFGHRAFHDAQGKSRISHCWLQSAVAQDTASVPFGREWTNAQSDALRRQVGNDDAQFYSKARAVDADLFELGTHMRRGATHGAHVLGTAAGNASVFAKHPVDDDVQIIAVQMPNTIAWDTSGFGKEMYMLSALHYVMNRAAQIAAYYGVPELPLVINFSYGWSAGRHDGASEMEIAIQDLLSARQAIQPKTALVMPTGNTFSNQMHARLVEADFDGTSTSIGWQVPPDDQTSSYLEIWFPEGFDPTGFYVTVTPPKGTQFDVGGSIPLSADPGPFNEIDEASAGDPRRFTEIEMGGQNIGQLSADKHLNSRWRVMLAIIPTTYTRSQTRRAPVGLWTITINRPAGTHLDDDAITVWVQRDDDPASLQSNGRQSYLVDLNPSAEPAHPLHQFPDRIDKISGYGALNAVANADLTVRVAGYVQSSKRPSNYSSAGGVKRDASKWGAQTTISAAADISPLLLGAPSIGTMSGSGSRYIGTSAAAPAVARLMAINAAAGLDLMDGMKRPPAIPAREPKGLVSQSSYSASMGPVMAPPITHSG